MDGLWIDNCTPALPVLGQALAAYTLIFGLGMAAGILIR